MFLRDIVLKETVMRRAFNYGAVYYSFAASSIISTFVPADQ